MGADWGPGLADMDNDAVLAMIQEPGFQETLSQAGRGGRRSKGAGARIAFAS